MRIDEVAAPAAVRARTAATDERSFGKDDKSHRCRLRELLADKEWHTPSEMRVAGGARYGSRVHELRRDLLDIEVQLVSPGVYHYRLRGELEAAPPRARDWKRRALEAEARVQQLERRLAAQQSEGR